MTYLPCADRVNDPDDWFIEKDGTQYGEDLVDDELRQAIVERAESLSVPAEPILEQAEELAVAEMLRRRRQARDLCFSECQARVKCLDLALDPPTRTSPDVAHGTRGGYYPEQLRKIVRLRNKRTRREAS